MHDASLFFDLKGLKMKKILLLLFVLVMFSGCSTVDGWLASDDEDGQDDMPWNTPASWEGNTGPGLRY